MNFPKIRACLFDMDGTIINSEDLYTECTSRVLKEFNKGPLTWDVKLKLQGRPGIESTKIVIKEYDLPVSPEEFTKKAQEIQKNLWHRTEFLPGAMDLLKYLKQNNVPIALGTSSNFINYKMKTAHLRHGFDLFGEHVITGDDKRILPGRGKPNPDIWHICLQSINDELKQSDLDPISMEECLIFEDGIPGVYSGIAANAFVIWIPDQNALKALEGKEEEIISDKGEIIKTLLHLDKSKYGL